jgi:hypothetical protein
MPRQQDQQIHSTPLLPRIGRTVFRVADRRPWVIRKLTKTKIQLSEPDSEQIEFTVSHDEFVRWFNVLSGPDS